MVLDHRIRNKLDWSRHPWFTEWLQVMCVRSHVVMTMSLCHDCHDVTCFRLLLYNCDELSTSSNDFISPDTWQRFLQNIKPIKSCLLVFSLAPGQGNCGKLQIKICANTVQKVIAGNTGVVRGSHFQEMLLPSCNYWSLAQITTVLPVSGIMR